MRILHASAYIVWCSLKNRMRKRLLRLREPRYMIGAVVAATYLYFAVWVRIGPQRGRTPRAGPMPSDIFGGPLPGLATSVGGVALLALATIAWVVPHSSGLLDFSEAEVQFLFPAPVSRRQLLLHRLARSQLGLLLAAMLPALLFGNPLQTGLGGSRVLRGIALWIVFVTVRVYAAAVALARARASSEDRVVRRVAWLPISLIIVAVGAVGIPISRSLMAGPPVGSFGEVMSRVVAATDSGLPRLVLWPFASLIRPFVSAWPWAYLSALLGALMVMGAAVIWLLRSDAAFQEATETTRRRLAERRGPVKAPRVRDLGWPLGLSGRTETLFLWKNAMQTLRGTNLAQAIRFVIPIAMLVVVGATARMRATGARGPAAGLATGALAIAGFFSILGPQGIHSDLRGDLAHLELLKTWPIRASALLRGELLWPTLLLTLATWLLLACAGILSAAAFPTWTLTARLSLFAAAVVLAPAVIAAQFTVHAGAAVLFPAWVPTGMTRPRGLEAMGQRMIFLSAIVLSLVVMIGPGAIAGGIVGFVLYRLVGITSVVPAAIICAVAVVIEVVVVTEILASRFERIDLSQVERAD